MFVYFDASRTGIRATVCRFRQRFQLLAVGVAAATALSGCMEGAAPLAGTDPADPGVKIRGVFYRSTIAPYTSLRPSSATGWKEQNQGVAPPPAKSQ